MRSLKLRETWKISLFRPQISHLGHFLEGSILFAVLLTFAGRSISCPFGRCIQSLFRPWFVIFLFHSNGVNSSANRLKHPTIPGLLLNLFVSVPNSQYLTVKRTFFPQIFFILIPLITSLLCMFLPYRQSLLAKSRNKVANMNLSIASFMLYKP